MEGVSPDRAEHLYDLIRSTAYGHGHRIAFTDNPDAPDVAVDGPVLAEPGGAVYLSPVNDLSWLWAASQLVLDLPHVKAFAGFPDDGVIQWGDGFKAALRYRHTRTPHPPRAAGCSLASRQRYEIHARPVDSRRAANHGAEVQAIRQVR